jgi:hypothetical protein
MKFAKNKYFFRKIKILKNGGPPGKKWTKSKNRPKCVFAFNGIGECSFRPTFDLQKRPFRRKIDKKNILNLWNFLKICKFLSKFMIFWQKNDFFRCFSSFFGIFCYFQLFFAFFAKITNFSHIFVKHANFSDFVTLSN